MSEELTQYDAFISHASQDSERAIEIYNALEERGLKCWIDKKNIRPGKKYAEEIVRGVRQSRCMVIVISNYSNQSDNVTAEAEEARKSGKPIFPVRIEDVQPSDRLAFYVSITQWLDLWQVDKLEKLEMLAKSIAGSDVENTITFDQSFSLGKFFANNRTVLLSVLFLSIVILVGFMLIKYELSDMPKYPNEFAVAKDLEDLTKDDFTISATPMIGPGYIEVIYSIYPNMFGMSQSNEFNNAKYILEFDNGETIEKASELYGSLTLTKRTTEATLPKWVQFEIVTTDSGTLGPFKFDLSHLADQVTNQITKQASAAADRQRKRQVKDLDRIKQRFKEGRVLYCSYFFGDYAHCRLAVSGSLTVEDTFTSIQFHHGDLEENINVNLTDNSHPDSVYVFESNEGRMRNIYLTIPLIGLEYSATYTDGSSSERYKADVQYSQQPKKETTLEFERLNENAPRLFTTSDQGSGYYSGKSSWSLMSIDEQANAMSWTMYEGGKNDLQKLNQDYFEASYIQFAEFGVDINSSESNYPELILAVTREDGSTNQYRYRANWKEWIQKSAMASIQFHKSMVNCSKYTFNYTDVSYSLCNFNVREPSDKVFSDVQFGTKPSQLKSKSEVDYAEQITQLEQRIIDYFDEKEKSGELSERDAKSKKSMSMTTITRLRRGLEFSSNNGSTQEQIVIFEQAEAYYFRFTLIDGTQSQVLRVLNR